MIRLAKILFLTGILSYAGFTLNQFYTVIHFYVHQEEIASTLCINKEVENSKCQGHCQLKSKLNLPSEQQVSTESNPTLRSGIIVFQSVQDFTSINLTVEPTEELASYPCYVAADSEKATITLLNPPEQIV